MSARETGKEADATAKSRGGNILVLETMTIISISQFDSPVGICDFQKARGVLSFRTPFLPNQDENHHLEGVHRTAHTSVVFDTMLLAHFMLWIILIVFIWALL